MKADCFGYLRFRRCATFLVATVGLMGCLTATKPIDEEMLNQNDPENIEFSLTAVEREPDRPCNETVLRLTVVNRSRAFVYLDGNLLDSVVMTRIEKLNGEKIPLIPQDMALFTKPEKILLPRLHGIIREWKIWNVTEHRFQDWHKVYMEYDPDLASYLRGNREVFKAHLKSNALWFRTIASECEWRTSEPPKK